jgi:hypothetical protein
MLLFCHPCCCTCTCTCTTLQDIVGLLAALLNRPHAELLLLAVGFLRRLCVFAVSAAGNGVRTVQGQTCLRSLCDAAAGVPAEPVLIIIHYLPGVSLQEKVTADPAFKQPRKQ